MNDRLFDRLTAAASIVLLLLLALGTYYIAEVARRGPPSAKKAGPTEPDFFVNDFSFVRLNDKGEPAFRVAAKKMVHYPDRDTSEFVQPLVTSLRPDRSRMTISAEKAVSRDIVTDQPGEILLQQKVLLVRMPAQGADPVRIESDGMILRPDTETASSDLPIKVTHGAAQWSAVGFELNHPAQTLLLKSEVRGLWNRPN